MPTGRQIHIDAPLTNFAVEAFNTAPNFVAQQVFPAVPVGKQSNKYYTLDQASFMLVPRTYRAPKTEANLIEFKPSSDSYFADNYALGGDNALEDLDNADDAIMLREQTTSVVVQGLLRDLEVRAFSKVTGNVSSTNRLTGASAWDAINSADIVGPVRDAKQAIWASTGLVPNTVVLDWRSYDYATRNNIAWSKLQYTQETGQLTLAHLKQLWDVENVYVTNALKNNAREGGTGSYTSIWGASCFVYYRPPSVNNLKVAAYGVGMRWTPTGFSTPMQVTRAVQAGAGTKNREVIEAGYFQDEKVIASGLGYLINTKSGTPW